MPRVGLWLWPTEDFGDVTGVGVCLGFWVESLMGAATRFEAATSSSTLIGRFNYGSKARGIEDPGFLTFMCYE